MKGGSIEALKRDEGWPYTERDESKMEKEKWCCLKYIRAIARTFSIMFLLFSIRYRLT